MSSTANNNPPVKCVAFHQSYELNFRSLDDYEFKEEVLFENVKMVHNNLGLEFRTVVYPAGMETDGQIITNNYRLFAFVVQFL